MDHGLLPEIEAFIARHRMKESTFGRLVDDRHIVPQLRAGRRLWPETAERIRRKMAALDAQRSSEAAAPPPAVEPSADPAPASRGSADFVAPQPVNGSDARAVEGQA